ncbi:MAG: tRNA (adenosine(37)-N6)-threonylcarbamoyltransferase complex dimerization subunit type 1 TsaB [Treponema sp.]
MNILAIDTVTSLLSIAAEGPKGLVTQTFAGNNRSHAEQLVPLVEATIALAGFTAPQIDVVLSSEGPGSFTGLRLGYSAAKALQLASDSAFVPIPTFTCIAHQYAAWQDGLAVIIDAKRDRFYTQLFKAGEPMGEPADSTIEEIIPWFTKSERWLVTGYGTEVFQKALAAVAPGVQCNFIENLPVCFAPSMISYAKQHMDTLVKAPDYLGPLYIRKSDAEKD